jgi:prepilin-type N-terminal cleavage/methylation domain-containing protein
MARDRCTGLTLLELLVCLALLGILLSQALPSFGQLKQRQRLELVAQTLLTDLQQARSEAVLHGETVQFRFSQHPLGSCYIIYLGASAQCRCSDAGQAQCTAPAAPIKLQWLPLSQQVSLRSNVGNMSFQARQGLVSSTGSIDVSNPNGQAIRAVVSIAGRVRNCAPNGEFKQMPKC